MASNELMAALGHGTAAVWGRLPTEVQHELFEAAVRSAGENTREQLAIFLHKQHPRTADSDRLIRDMPEPDSLGG